MADSVWTGGAGDGAWSTAGNWSNGIPGNTDRATFNQGSESVTAGLAQSGTTLGELVLAEGYEGSIGSSSGRLVINATDVIADGGGQEIWLDGTYTAVRAERLRGRTNALQLDGTIVDLFMGALAAGIITVADAATLVYAHQLSESGLLVIGASVSGLQLVEANAGRVQCASACAAIRGLGGEIEHTAGAVTTCDVDGAVVRYHGSGTLGTLVVDKGRFTLEDNQSEAVTIGSTAVTINGGEIVDSNLQNVSWPNGIVKNGGRVLPGNGRVVDIT